MCEQEQKGKGWLCLCVVRRHPRAHTGPIRSTQFIHWEGPIYKWNQAPAELLSRLGPAHPIISTPRTHSFTFNNFYVTCDWFFGYICDSGGEIFNRPSAYMHKRVCLCVRLLSHLSPLECLFVLKILSRTQRTIKIKTSGLLRCRDPAPPVERPHVTVSHFPVESTHVHCIYHMVVARVLLFSAFIYLVLTCTSVCIIMSYIYMLHVVSIICVVLFWSHRMFNRKCDHTYWLLTCHISNMMILFESWI